MSRSTRESAATRALLARVEQKSTGKLTVGAGAVEVAVYVLHGDVVAATAGDDDRQLVRQLFERGVIDGDRAEQFENLVDEGRDVFGDLLDLGEPVEPLLRDRFRQNVSDFVASVSTPQFFQQKGVFVANIQMGHDTRALIDEICAEADRASQVDLDALVVLGEEPAGSDPDRLAVAELLGDEPRTISSLLHEVALEPTRARCVIADLLNDGVAMLHLESTLDDDDTVSVQRAPEPEPEPAPEPEPTPAPDEEPEPTPLPDFEPEPTPEPVHEPPPTLDDEDLDAFADDEDESAGDPPTVSAPAAPTPAPAPPAADDASGAPRSLSDWLDKSNGHVGQDELDFFTDHDFDRGSDKSGRFRTEEHNLEKFEVASLGGDDDDANVALEADEAPAARFGAPVLSEDEALAKLGVANEVLQLVSKAFDDAEGAGRGRAVMQLLVDGCPSQFASLLHDIEVTEDGELPDEVIYENLATRPTTEHRQLLNGALVDVIERALSSAADELPDEQLDHVLESIAGYRQRLGL